MHILRILFGAFHPSAALVLALWLEYSICMASLAIVGVNDRAAAVFRHRGAKAQASWACHAEGWFDAHLRK
ncbi:MAG: hypothetical protein U0R19_12545 [Bryobacteraceae bacterium]